MPKLGEPVHHVPQHLPRALLEGEPSGLKTSAMQCATPGSQGTGASVVEHREGQDVGQAGAQSPPSMSTTSPIGRGAVDRAAERDAAADGARRTG